MLHEHFVIHDAKASAYLKPFYSQSIGTAVREVTEAVNSDGHGFNKWASDYSLYHMGNFDDSDATSHYIHPPHFVTQLSQLLDQADHLGTAPIEPTRITSEEVEDNLNEG